MTYGLPRKDFDEKVLKPAKFADCCFLFIWG